MFIKFFQRPKRPPSERLIVAYQAACQQVGLRLDQGVRKWETQPIQRRKMQLILGLLGLLLLGSLSVYYTATGLGRPGHLHTRINQKNHEQQPSVGFPRRK